MTALRFDTLLRRAARPAALVIFSAVLLLSAWAHSSAEVSYDFEQPVFFEKGQTVKDHALVCVDGLFHLYYTTGDGAHLGYATSPDLRHWTDAGEILAAGPDEWDRAGVWAPSVVPYPHGPGYYLMFYTGVNAAFAQRTCLAMSHVLHRWNKITEPLFTPFHGDTLWMRWNENEWSNYRDPGFYAEGDTCYLAHTAQTRDNRGAIALARSIDRFRWEDAGALYVHDSWHALESPFVLKRAGVYHLFFTEETVGGVSHMSSPSLTGGWSILNRSIIDGGHAAEVLDLGADRYLISRHTSYTSAAELVSTIKMDTLVWKGTEPAVEMANRLEGWSVLWGTAFQHQPTFRENAHYRGDDTTRTGFEGNWWIGTYESFAGPLSGTDPGSFQGDAPRGAIRSTAFTVTGRSMRLLVGGGDYLDSCYVALCDATTGAILLRETGRNRDLMDERLWDLSPYIGTEVYLLIVDDCSSSFGHINVDGIEERPLSISPPPDGDGSTPSPMKRPPRFERQSARSAGAGRASETLAAITGTPNPFNPETEISVCGAPGSILSITIYDAAGRRLRSFSARAGADGTAAVRWDGRDRSGAALPAGVYFAALRGAARGTAVTKLVLAR